MLTSNIIAHCFFRLETGERGKFARDRPASDKLTGQTLTGDEFIGELYRANKALIPQAMDRWGTPGPLFTHFLSGVREPPAPMTYPPSTPWAAAMNKRACSSDVPYGILNTASKNWLHHNPDGWYGDTYIDANPKTWALGQFGLGCTLALTDHIHTSHDRVTDLSEKSHYTKRRAQPDPRRRAAATAAATPPTVAHPTPTLPPPPPARIRFLETL